MPVISRVLLILCLLASPCRLASAQAPSPLSEEQRKLALESDEMTIPTPAELFVALDKQGKPNWSQFFRPPVPTTDSSRSRLALGLGALVADGYIAVEAQDSQQVKNIGKDIIALARSLGVGGNVIARGNSISEFAENNEWNALKEELDATENEVKKVMIDMRDSHLVTLVLLGGWIRGTEVVAAAVKENYTPERAMILRQAGLVRYLRRKLDALTPKQREEAILVSLAAALEQMEVYVSSPVDVAPTEENIALLNQRAGELTREIAKKP